MSKFSNTVRRTACVVLLALSLGLPSLAAAQEAKPGTLDLAAGDKMTAEDVAAIYVPPGSVLPSQPAPLKAMNRVVTTMRASLLGHSAKDRAEHAEARVQSMLAHKGDKPIRLQDRPEGTVVLVNERPMFALLLQDSIEGTASAAHLQAEAAAAKLAQVIGEAAELRDMRSMLTSAGIAVLATLVLLALLLLLFRARRRLQLWLARETQQHTKEFRLGGLELFSSKRLIEMERWALTLIYWLLVLLLVYQWLGVCLGLFPYTRVWAEGMNGFLFGLASRFVLAVAHAIPDLIAAAVIFTLAMTAHRLIKRFFKNVELGLVQVSWLDADVAPVTARLSSIAVWIFALAMAYPYLPGSDTEAFRGLSVLLGLMISLGASNLVGQAASGLILTYTRTLRVGEFVQAAGQEGTVMSLGTFSTRIRNGMGEELTISNSQVLGDVTKNYSRAVKGSGFIVDTVVTIGYDTPWRQVRQLLVEAALRTPGVLADPAPHVFQVALSDFYPEYRLVCQAVPHDPRPRAEVISMLHANIQDLFNEYGVQIMSPHYRGDPQQAKLVPKEQWYAAPARPPADLPQPKEARLSPE